MKNDTFLRILNTIQSLTQPESEKSLEQFKIEINQLDPSEDINSKHTFNKQSYTLLEYAIELYLSQVGRKSTSSLYKAIKILIQHRADASLFGGKFSPLHQIVSYNLGEHTAKQYEQYEANLQSIADLLQLLFDYRADFSIKDGAGNTLLHSAVSSGNYSLVGILHDFGCGLNCYNKGLAGESQTVLDILNNKAADDTDATICAALIKTWGAVSYKSLKAIVFSRYKLTINQQQVKVSIGEIKSAEENDKLAELFSNESHKTYIQSNYPYKLIRALLDKVAARNFKNAQMEKEKEEKQRSAENAENTLFAKSPSESKQEMYKQFLNKIKASCTIGKEELFTKNVLLLIEEIGKSKALTEINLLHFGLNKHNDNLKRFKEASQSLFEESSPTLTRLGSP